MRRRGRTRARRVVPVARRPPRLRSLPVATVLAAVVALSFLSGGYIFSRTAPVVFVLLPLAALWVWLAPRRLRLGRAALVGLSALALFTLWEGLSIAWSVGPDLSWLAFDVSLLYLIVAAVITARRPGLRSFVWPATATSARWCPWPSMPSSEKCCPTR